MLLWHCNYSLTYQSINAATGTVIALERICRSMLLWHRNDSSTYQSINAAIDTVIAL